MTTGYGSMPVLKKVSLEVSKSTITGMIGPNGSGKTTFIKTVVGLNRPWEGKIVFQNTQINGKSTHEITRMGISLAPEGRRLFQKMTVMENLLIGSYPVKKGDSKLDRLEYVFQLFPILKQRKNQEAGTLSGGEQQMLNIGRALMSSPQLLILDEPSLGLAPVITKQLFSVIARLRDEGFTILLSEQNAALTLNISDYVYVLEHGSVAVKDTPQSLMRNDVIRQTYLGV
ncbi:MAG: ABC transporter ATP-binding protein [Candidatus Caldarchaeum sp.]|nr:ABC transporter ATP-binding protein [Candidatus Caldarchaeum sp.]MDW7977565.1 ABC transporter ATP-binding protein [Candidatus Caldarchaeum sp.]